jgi:hypothetical protein
MSRTIHAQFTPQGPTLQRFWDSNGRRRFLLGPLGSGKTFTCAMEALRRTQEQEPSPDGVRRVSGLVTRTNSTDLETSALKDWLDLTEGKFQGQLGTFNWASPRVHELRYNLPDGTRVQADIFFLGLDDPDGVNKIRGTPLTWAWVNECKDVPLGLLRMIFARCGRYRPDGRPPTWSGLFGDTNFPHVGHWIYEFAENEHPDGWEFFKQPGGLIKVDGRWVPNPLAENSAFIGPEYYLDQLAGAPEEWVSVYLGANYGFALSGKPVYPEYVDNVHCKAFEVPRGTGVRLRVGLDFGHTPAAIIGWRLPNGAWRWHSEVVTDDFGIVRFAEVLGRHLREHYRDIPIAGITGDPSGEVFESGDTEERDVFRILAAHGIKAGPAPTNDPTVRREAVAIYMTKMIDGEPGFLIHPQCKMARVGLAGGFKYKSLKGEFEGMVRAKRDKSMYSHAVEAGEYMMLGAGEARELMKPMPAAPASRRRATVAEGIDDDHFGLE